MEATENEVLTIPNSIKEEHSAPEIDKSMDQSTKKHKKTKVKIEETNVRGKPKSGRFWKSNKERFSSVNKNKGLKQPFVKKAALRTELKRIKDLSQQLKAKKAEQEEQRKQRRRENIKRTDENKRKSEIVQVITNTAKIKRMRKKQLRFIQKRDTTDATAK